MPLQVGTNGPLAWMVRLPATLYLPRGVTQLAQMSPDAFRSLPFEVQSPAGSSGCRISELFFLFGFLKEAYLCVREWILTTKTTSLGVREKRWKNLGTLSSRGKQ